VWINQAEINALAECLQISAADFESQYVRRVGIRRSLVERDNYDCVFLDPQTRRCQVYQARPRQCRTWPFWKSNVKSPTAWQQTCEVCPGSGTGDLYSLEAIEQRVREIDL
jgi:Fe-S-cluster containining protein